MLQVFDEIRAILQKHKEKMPVIVTAEILASVDEAEAKWKADCSKSARLIDANAFKERIGTETKMRRMMCMAIDEQPTAYDVEKVEVEVGKILEINTGRGSAPYFGIMNIIRKGGVE